MRWAPEDRATVSAFGLVALLGFSIALWHRQRPMPVVSGGPNPAQARRWDEGLRAARQVDVNTATGAALARLPQIGPALAERIVAFRDANGPFRDADDLAGVPGIGPKTVEALREYVSVGKP